MKRFSVLVTLSVILALTAAGCKKEATAPAPQGLPAGHPAISGNDAGKPAGSGPSGKVVETMNSGGYTYVNLENNGKKTWVAVPQAKVKVGQNISCQPGMVMNNFTSKTLNRTFESIIFSGGII